MQYVSLSPDSRRFRLKHFKVKEFNCPCCGVRSMDEHLLRLLDSARIQAGVPFVINSGYRCRDHNHRVGGSPTSSHLKGLAADIATLTARKRFQILKALIYVGFTRIGISEGFVHVDVDPDKQEDSLWVYSTK